MPTIQPGPFCFLIGFTAGMLATILCAMGLTWLRTNEERAAAESEADLLTEEIIEHRRHRDSIRRRRERLREILRERTSEDVELTAEELAAELEPPNANPLPDVPADVRAEHTEHERDSRWPV